MPTIREPVHLQLSQNARRVSWEQLNYVDPTPGPEDKFEGRPVALLEHTDASVQMIGNFAAGTVIFEGSNDGGTTWATLNDVNGNPLSFSTPKVEQILELARLVRPRVNVGDEAMDVDVFVFMRQQRGGEDT